MHKVFTSLAAAVSLAAAFGVGLGTAPAQAQLYNPCPYTNDGDCDEPNGLNLCEWGTDQVDCSNPNSNYAGGAGYSAGIYATPQPAPAPVPASCPYTNDGDCDEPNGLDLCPWGSDAVDCSNPNSYYGSGAGYYAGIYATQQPAPAPTPVPASCPYTNDGDCDEPNGLNLCPWGSDAVDCSNPNSNHGSGPGYYAGIYAGGAQPPAPTPAPQPTQPAMTAVSQGAFVHGGGGGTSGCPNYAIANTAFGQHTMYAGQGSYRVPRITAGGRYALTNCFPGTGWRGYTITRPDFRFFYSGVSSTGRITFQLTSNAVDTVLLINTPDGQWFFNDDSNGTFNSTLTFSPVLQGQYDIWAGAYNLSSNNPAELWVYE
ncbi:hypothetical protein HKCCE4037_18730 [Rhodobacterales bacterium HKCCE4037]|nr:hypothetical protein [Rhodobacterales bacterium HKCCE4037]